MNVAKNKNEEQKNSLWMMGVIGILLLATLLATILKIRVSLDMDEEYAVLLGARFAYGEKLFSDIRDTHLTSIFPAGFFCMIYQKITGSYDGVVIFLRGVTAILIDVYAIVFWRITSKYYEKTWIPALLIANFTFKGELNMEFSFIASYLMLWVCLILLYLHQEHKSKGKVWCLSILAILLYGGSVLAYPTMIVTVLLVPFVVYGVTGSWKLTGKIIGGCVLLGLLCIGAFLLVVLRFADFSLFINLIGQYLDGNHAKLRSFTQAVFSDPRSKQMWIVILGSGALYVIVTIWRTGWINTSADGNSNAKKSLDMGVFKKMICSQLPYLAAFVILVNSLMLLGINLLFLLTGKTTTVLIRYVIIYLAAIPLWKKGDKALVYTFGLPGFGLMVGALMGSDGGIANLIHFTFPVLLMIVLWLLQEARESTDDYVLDVDAAETKIKNAASSYLRLIEISLLLFILAFAMNRANNLRVTHGLPASLSQERQKITLGPCKGIYVLPEDAKANDRKVTQIRSLVSDMPIKVEKISYMGFDHQLLNLCTDAKPSVAFSGGASKLGVGWKWFYETHSYPEVFFFDKETYGDLSGLRQDSFIEDLLDQAEENEYELLETEDLYVLRKNNKN